MQARLRPASRLGHMPQSRGETASTSSTVGDLAVRCPSCDHGNPAGSRFCNECGMPVHFETCGRCEAINRRGAVSCHKCGCALPWRANPTPAAVADAIAEPPRPQVVGLADADADSPPDIAEPAPKRRHAGVTAAFMALAAILVAVPAYIATEHPGPLDGIVDAISRRGNVDSDRSEVVNAPQPPPTVQSAQPIDAPVGSAAASHEAASAVQQAASPSRVEATAGNSRSHSKAPPTTRAATKSAPASTSKSKATRSKPTKSSRKPSSGKACDQGSAIPGCR